MTVEGRQVAEQWGRRLMATNPENETLEKNCSEPGMLLKWWRATTQRGFSELWTFPPFFHSELL